MSKFVQTQNSLKGCYQYLNPELRASSGPRKPVNLDVKMAWTTQKKKEIDVKMAIFVAIFRNFIGAGADKVIISDGIGIGICSSTAKKFWQLR